ncbi:hypothetical protein X777_15875 [Ooceraea biroi]|uniref:Uncharacterized protein n=1 Tax=Ooceraea biroi TaxID=2015173 RepID=A0A026WT95_OOCBI|nr:hypothetical protein X777_15875 [Ooceraea biroi]
MRSRDSVVYTPVSLGPDTDDEETLVNEEVYKNAGCDWESRIPGARGVSESEGTYATSEFECGEVVTHVGTGRYVGVGRGRKSPEWIVIVIVELRFWKRNALALIQALGSLDDTLDDRRVSALGSRTRSRQNVIIVVVLGVDVVLMMSPSSEVLV